MLLTLSAQAFEVNGIIQNLEGDVAEFRRRELVQAWMVDVGHAIAAPADEMVMMVGVAVESSRGFEMVSAPRQPQIDKGFQCAVDRRARHARHALLDVFVELVHGRMIVAVEQRVQHHASLHSHGQTPFVADRFEKRELFLFVTLSVLQIFRFPKIARAPAPCIPEVYYYDFESTGKPSPLTTALAKYAIWRS
jgi:hypothetical protein